MTASDSSTTDVKSDTPPLEKPEVSAPIQTTRDGDASLESIAYNMPGVDPAKVAAIMHPTSVAKRRSPKRLRVRFALLALAIVVVAVILWVFLRPQAVPDQPNTAVVPVADEASYTGLVATLIEGDVTMAKEGGEWQVLDAEAALAPGDSIRTARDSRVVLTLDDGSAVRLDAGTTVKMKSLALDGVVVELVEGAVYSRVVPSDRKYTVAVEEKTYQAMGTAYVVTNKPGDSGVQVYESAVKVAGLSAPVLQGQQYYSVTIDDKLLEKVTTIDVAKLVNNSFALWNLDQDEKDAKFKDKLGVLGQIEEEKRAQEEKKVREAAEKKQAEEAAKKREAEEAAAKKKAEEAAKKEQDDNEPDTKKDSGKKTGKVTRGNMTLTRQGNNLVWSYSGKAVYGYKVVYSTSSKKPRLDRHQSIHVSNPSQTSLAIPKEFKRGSTYVTVCAYTNNTEPEACVDYSSQLEI